MALPIVPNGVDSSTQELLDAQTHIWNHIFNFINSMSLKCAIQLGIPDVIHKHGKPMTLSELADALPINEAKLDGLHRLMRILVHSNFFQEEKEAYCLTRASRLLLRDEPLSVAPFALAMLDPVLVDPFHHMGGWFQNEASSPFLTKHGKNLWEYAGEEQSWNQLFNEGMASDARFVTSILTKHCKQVFEGLETMVDVGGGTGTVAKAVADAFPGLKCIVLDLPHVVEGMEEFENLRYVGGDMYANACMEFEGLETMVDVGGGTGMVAKAVADAFPGLKCIVLDLPHVVDGMEDFENLRYVGGDMFESIPQADAVFLKWIFHDWLDQESIKLLKKCKEAIIPTGKIIIVDMVVDERNENRQATSTQLLFDMLMMTVVTGKERTEKDWEKLFFAAGFKSYKITHALGLRSVIEVFP